MYIFHYEMLFNKMKKIVFHLKLIIKLMYKFYIFILFACILFKITSMMQSWLVRALFLD
jgi:hypothetical protein